MDIEFCKSLPKLELHAHLNGSLSEKTLKELHVSEESINDFLKLNRIFDLGASRTLQECFELFKVAHNVTNHPEAVTKATQDVIQEFADDGVIYLELRTTPRQEAEMTKKQYIDAVIEGIEICSKTVPSITVKLILSLDRKSPVDNAKNTLDLALEYLSTHPQIVKGLDVSGDPTKGTWFKDIVTEAREHELNIAIHCAEVPNPIETEEIIDFSPDRIGHGTCIVSEYGGSDELFQKFLDSKIPVECCLTSNVKTKTVDQYSDHHVKDFIRAKHPFTISTDDKGVFATSLSEELKIAADHFDLSKQDLWQICYDSINFCFCSDEEKAILRRTLEEWHSENM